MVGKGFLSFWGLAAICEFQGGYVFCWFLRGLNRFNPCFARLPPRDFTSDLGSRGRLGLNDQRRCRGFGRAGPGRVGAFLVLGGVALEVLGSWVRSSYPRSTQWGLVYLPIHEWLVGFHGKIW